jgi:hypothetical protein
MEPPSRIDSAKEISVGKTLKAFSFLKRNFHVGLNIFQKDVVLFYEPGSSFE